METPEWLQEMHRRQAEYAEMLAAKRRAEILKQRGARRMLEGK